ncbi:N-acetylmuramoyl-L-alanine amidase [Pontixanthobacter aestiaquae]|uniref:N-acetylmuramoyl-L-alanine amidase n=1 Tax=Pontixanthobacter aestiaquae TaxID=1509367 RepID=A0A844Z879_9SPHN|nr:N-acetylmuramoyl-L-alanine amidase [Pontixanthobacter aestiaquae]MDN3645294.1 N-acetylmuramoyl-L-alanine amidase [Pontixanthobacter aestiaquae]MXO83704.1 N-acetylmuramoyl-L-alanine amidase [Pontixanthobacter aestiaquae]
MSLRMQLWLIFLAPVLLVGGLYALGLSIPVPHLGRDYVIRLALPEAGQPVDLPEILGPEDRSRPLVVIDAGHGGHDPGASGGGFREKDLVLGLAKALRDQLVEEGGIRVALTRDDDTFLVLEERPEIARRLDADLFISIHADSSGEISTVSGASIYTLSNEASSEAAARFAERENEASALNGAVIAGQSEDVSNILVELSQRRVQQHSAEFASLITREGNGVLKFHPQRRRSAALGVLRAPDVPAVLYESGFITNPSDAARLASEEGRQQFAEVMARAIRIYFARQSGE